MVTSATVTVRGKATGGYPAISMALEIYDKGVKIKSKPVGVVSIGTVYEDSVGVTGAGIHTVYGRMVLTNALGSYEFLTPTKEFELAPPAPTMYTCPHCGASFTLSELRAHADTLYTVNYPIYVRLFYYCDFLSRGWTAKATQFWTRTEGITDANTIYSIYLEVFFL